MTTTHSPEAIRRAARALQAELERNAEALSAALSAPLPGETVDPIDAAEWLTMHQIYALSPREVDEHLAALYEEYARAQLDQEKATTDLHYALGERRRQVRIGRRTFLEWPTADRQALELARQMDPNARAGSYIKTWGQLVERVDQAMSRRARAMKASERLEARYRRAPWSRFFEVISSDNGHIHKSRTCSTCRPTTRYGWHPELSGKTEAEAVEMLGARLCTICFPAAPTAITTRQPTGLADCNNALPLQ